MKQFICLEFFGSGDPFFGGKADDRPLGSSWSFLRGVHSRSDYAYFNSREAALNAGNAAANRRPGGKLLSFDVDAVTAVVRRAHVRQRRAGMEIG